MGNCTKKPFLLVQNESFYLERKRFAEVFTNQRDSKFLTLVPFFEPNGLLRSKRCTQLLENATLAIKYPVIPDPRHPSVQLFLRHLHEKHCHLVVVYLRASTQQNFSILKVHTTLRYIQLKIVTYRKPTAEVFTRVMADLFWEKEFLNNVLNWNQQTLTDLLVKKNIKWKFNPPSAPHHGGVSEQIVRSLKQTFYAILSNRRLIDWIHSNKNCTIEQSLNAGPIVPPRANVAQLYARTLKHFPLGIASLSQPPFANFVLDQLKRYSRAHAYSDANRCRWLKEYVPSLNSRTKWPSRFHRDLKTSDHVWIVEPTSRELTILLIGFWNWTLTETSLLAWPESDPSVETWSSPSSHLSPFSPLPFWVKNLSSSRSLFFQYRHCSWYFLVT